MTGKELITFARTKLGIAYVYGMKGTIMTTANYNYLKGAYGKKVWDSDVKKVGKLCVDCSGLIAWATGRKYSSTQLSNNAIKKMDIKSILDAPLGALVWLPGHVGIYTGTKGGVPYYIAADGSAYGVREVPLSKNNFTHWLLMDYIEYEAEEEEMVEEDKIIVDDKEYTVSMIRKDGVTYIKTRDLADAIGAKVSSKGRIPVLKTQ